MADMERKDCRCGASVAYTANYCSMCGASFCEVSNCAWPEQVLDWAFTMFGPIAYNRRERALRLLEEATELAQAEGVELETAVSVATRVYSRPAGNVVQEIGQVHMTLAALAFNIGEDADTEGRREFDRVKAIPKEEWKRRHDAKVVLGIASN